MKAGNLPRCGVKGVLLVFEVNSSKPILGNCDVNAGRTRVVSPWNLRTESFPEPFLVASQGQECSIQMSGVAIPTLLLL